MTIIVPISRLKQRESRMVMFAVEIALSQEAIFLLIQLVLSNIR